MADFNIKNNPVFKNTMRKLETSDRAHANVFNALFETLLDNDNSLKKSLEKGDISETKVGKIKESSAEFPAPEKDDTQETLWGKLKKWQQDCLAKFGNYVLTSMITNQHLNDTNRIPTSALVYLMQQSITQLNRDLGAVATKLNTLGVVPPESGTGTHNTYYIRSGSTFFRKINGVCFLYFDIEINDTYDEHTILVENLPWCSMSIYLHATSLTTGTDYNIFYSYGTELRCGAGKAGRYFGALVYPTI